MYINSLKFSSSAKNRKRNIKWLKRNNNRNFKKRIKLISERVEMMQCTNANWMELTPTQKWFQILMKFTEMRKKYHCDFNHKHSK